MNKIYAYKMFWYNKKGPRVIGCTPNATTNYQKVVDASIEMNKEFPTHFHYVKRVMVDEKELNLIIN